VNDISTRRMTYGRHRFDEQYSAELVCTYTYAYTYTPYVYTHTRTSTRKDLSSGPRTHLKKSVLAHVLPVSALSWG